MNSAYRVHCLFSIRLVWALFAGGIGWAVHAPGAETRGAEGIAVGAARVEVTPTEPIRLTGYAARSSPHVGVEQRLWAKALAIGEDGQAAVLITLDNCGIAEETWRAVRSRLQRSAGLSADRVVIASSHTHSAPATTHWAPNIFVRDLTAAEQGAIDRYTTNLVRQLEEVALAALQARRPGRLAWAQGSAGFAANRRTQGGPVDRAMPVLKAENADGTVLALVANYACHCTTLGGEFNRACGDWAGYAQEAIEAIAPGAVALVTIGCGADANPSPRGGPDAGLALAKQHGQEIGAEVKRLLGLNFRPLPGRLSARANEIQLPFGPAFTREQWEARSTRPGIVGYHATKWLARLDRGESVPSSLYYPITTWTFGADLALVFLPGEVVVDYALRLKRELDATRVWVTGYANYVPCYIPSRRILAEGGYEAEESLWYYDRPARISTNAEDLIIRTVQDLVPASFRSDPDKAEHPDPRSPREALNTFQLPSELAIELVASEPLVQSPVAVDWDARGRLWVCEMFDYPAGLNPPADGDRKYGEPLREPPGGFTPGGRVKILTDTDGDGLPDRSTVFLDRVPFPTGVMPWKGGALICAAPNILFAVDTDGDGRADRVRTNVTGFATHNYQARVNGLRWGLDGWLHGSSGLFGGKVKVLGENGAVVREVDLSGRDFRYRPDTGDLEPVTGISQMGRVRDDFDQWFGNDNSTWLWHYPLPDHYVRRNPHVIPPEPRVAIVRGAEAQRVHPLSRTLTRFNDPHMANVVTSACGPEVYRDEWLGEPYRANAFICEPVHNLVRRLVLEPEGISFAARTAPGEDRGEFLVSSDNWFRPVQARTGPDGALYIVDMYRFVIEHPRWIPPDRLKVLDVRAGADRGRIYRVVRKGKRPRGIPDLTEASNEILVAALDTPNGPTRDHVHQQMLARGLPREDRDRQPAGEADPSEAKFGPARGAFGGMSRLERLVSEAVRPEVRAQALGIAGEVSGLLPSALRDPDPRVRALALRLAEARLASGSLGKTLRDAVLAAAADPDPRVRWQAALSLGESRSGDFTLALQRLMPEADRWRRAAILSGATARASELLDIVIASDWPDPTKSAWASALTSTLLGARSGEGLAGLLRSLSVGPGGLTTNRLEGWRVETAERLLAGLRQPGRTVASAVSDLGLDPGAAAALEPMIRRAAEAAAAPETDSALRLASLRLLGAADSPASLDALMSMVGSDPSAEWQGPAVSALGRSQRDEVAERLLAGWARWAPSLRGAIIDVLLNRPAWTERLLRALEQGQVRPVEIGPAQRQRLLRGSSASHRARAEQALASAASDSNRADVVARYQAVNTLVGQSDRGVAVFDRICAPCHRLRGRGFDVGPNLAEFSAKSLGDYLVAVLDPNAAINPNFVAYELETKDGRTLTGIVRHETASGLTLVQGGGLREQVLRSEVRQLRAVSVSLMPEGLEQGCSVQDMADLIAWVRGQAPAAFGRATPEQASLARREHFAGDAAAKIDLVQAADRLVYPGWLGTWPLAYCRQAAGQERLSWKARPGAARGPAGQRRFVFPAAMGFLSEPAAGFTLTVNGRSPVTFDVSLVDAEWLSADGKVRVYFEAREVNRQDACGPLTIEWADGGGPSKGGDADPVDFQVTARVRDSQRWFGLYLVEPGSR